MSSTSVARRPSRRSRPTTPRWRRRLSGLERFDLDKQPLNNAVLVNYLIYFHQLDNFAALDRMNHGDMRATIAQIISIAKAHPEDPFYAISQAVRSAPASTDGSQAFSAATIARDSSASRPPKK